LFKIVLKGDSNVGKTNISSRFRLDEFYPNWKQGGVDFETKII